MDTVSAHWQTERLIIRDAVLRTDLERLQQLWMGSSFMGEFDGYFARTKDEMTQDLTEGDVPPNGSREFFKIQPCLLKATQEIIGYIAMYHGHPDEKTIWISFFYVDPTFQNAGYGQEVIEQLSSVVRDAGFSRIGLQVALKNWPALRFWTKQGFQQITGVYGDHDYNEKSYANLALLKDLHEP